MIQFRQMLPKLVIGHFKSVPHCVHHGDVAHGAGAYEPSSLVDAQHHRLAIDDEPLVPVLERGLDDPRIQSADAEIPIAAHSTRRRGDDVRHAP